MPRPDAAEAAGAYRLWRMVARSPAAGTTREVNFSDGLAAGAEIVFRLARGTKTNEAFLFSRSSRQIRDAAPRRSLWLPPLATKRNSFYLRWRLALSIKKIRRLVDLLPLKSAMSLITIYT
jgi:hypothetical protein